MKYILLLFFLCFHKISIFLILIQPVLVTDKGIPILEIHGDISSKMLIVCILSASTTTDWTLYIIICAFTMSLMALAASFQSGPRSNERDRASFLAPISRRKTIPTPARQQCRQYFVSNNVCL